MEKPLTRSLSPRLTDSVKFQPKKETLKPLSELLRESAIKLSDVSDANEAWKSHCPDPEFKNLLEAN
jgi:hypothetical protein